MKDISTTTQQKDVRHIVEQLNGIVIRGYNTDIAGLISRISALETASFDHEKILVNSDGDVLTNSDGMVLMV